MVGDTRFGRDKLVTRLPLAHGDTQSQARRHPMYSGGVMSGYTFHINQPCLYPEMLLYPSTHSGCQPHRRRQLRLLREVRWRAELSVLWGARYRRVGDRDVLRKTSDYIPAQHRILPRMRTPRRHKT